MKGGKRAEGRRPVLLAGGKVRLSAEVWAEGSTVWLVGDSVSILHAKQTEKWRAIQAKLILWKGLGFSEPNRRLW
jgi:hypothetical protein